MREDRWKGLLGSHSCIGCVFYAICGELTRKEPCPKKMSTMDLQNMGEIADNGKERADEI